MKNEYTQSRKDDQQNIKNAEQILSAIYNSTHSVRLLLGTDCTIQFFNKKANEKAVSCYGKELKIGNNFLDYAKHMLLNIDEDLKSHIRQALQGRHVLIEREVKNLKTSFWYKIEYFPLFSESKPMGVSISIRDISEKKNNELYIKKQNAILKDIIFFESHIVREPVANILGLIQLLNKTKLRGSNREIIEMLEKTTKKLDEITRTIVKKCDNVFYSRNKNKRNKQS